MGPALTRAALGATFVLVSAVVLWAVRGNERILAQGQVVLAELAPVDPRSLMQGDYMALRYAIDTALSDTPAKRAAPPPAYAWLHVDEAGRATLAGTGEQLPAPTGLVAMRIRGRDGTHSIGPNAFFFQEGSGEGLAGARWGEFRVDARGKALLTHLRDERLERLGENRR